MKIEKGLIVNPNFAIPSRFSDWLKITKPRIMSLAVFTALVAIIVTPKHNDFNLFQTVLSLLAIAIGAASSGIYNMYFERSTDSKMARTKNRPLVTRDISPDDALGLANFLAIFSIALLGLSANWLSAFLLALTIFFYAIIYTLLLKPYFSQNIVIGGLAGALPPVIGASVATHGEITSLSIYCLLLIFLWTPPHFWSLAILYEKDYKAANIPMMNIIVGNAKTAKYCFVYTLLLIVLSPIAYYLTPLGNLFLIFSTVLNVVFAKKAFDFYKLTNSGSDIEKVNLLAKDLFFNSIFYLFSSFLIILIDQTI